MLSKLKHIAVAALLALTPVMGHADDAAVTVKDASPAVVANAASADANATSPSANATVETVNYDDPNMEIKSTFVSESAANCMRGDNQVGTADGCISSHGLNKVVNGNSGEVYAVTSGDSDSNRAPSSTKSVGK